MGVAHLAPAADGQTTSLGEADLPNGGLVNMGRLDQAAVWAEGTKSLREEDDLWMTLARRADLLRRTIQRRVVTPTPAMRPPRRTQKGKRADTRADERTNKPTGDLGHRQRHQHPSPQLSDLDEQPFLVSPQPHAQQLWRWIRRTTR